ncbi:MAG: hypothetical protein COA45_12070 [Zetaproteobacteria bacterium]|nr:MAG: hypothetical protein COA45_12070 [Zetaproteobacteria bacterium]
MLSFASPIRLIEGHAVFSDSDDPELFYVAPREPRLAVNPDGRPLFSMTQYMNLGDGVQDTLWGGFLSISTTFGLEVERLARIHEMLREDVSDSARVAPLPFHSGDVRLVLLGQEMRHDGDVDDLDGDGNIFALDILGSGKPSLDGQGRASFQVSLSGKAAALLEQAVDQVSIPALINYSMVIEGLRPGFNVKITANWSNVYKELQQKLNANIYYVRADLENKVKETFQNVGVKIETVVEDVNSADDAIAAEKALMDWALNVFFKPSHNQQGDTAAMINGVADGVGSLINSLMPGVSLKLKQIREEEVKTFSAELNRTIAERRTLTFDGTLGQVFSHYHFDENGNEKPEWAALKDTLVVKVDVPEAPKLEVNLSIVDRFQLDGIGMVIVDIARKVGDEFVDQKQFHFAAADNEFSYIVSLLNEDPATLGESYYYKVSVKFDPSAVFGDGEDAVGEWIENRSQALKIDPRADTPYAMTTVSVQGEIGFPFNQFEEVTVELRVPAHEDGAEVFNQHHRIVLSQNNPSANWQFRSDIVALYDYRVTYLKPAGSGDNIGLDWVRIASPLLTISNPASASRRLNIINNLPWDRITFASLEINYDDDDNDIHINEQISLDQATRMIQRSYAIAQRNKQTLTYRLTALFINGQFLVGDWRESDDSTLIVGAHLVEERHIRILTRFLPISEHNLKSIQLELEAVNDDDVPVHTISLRINAEDEKFPNWSYLAGSPPLKKVRVKAKFTAIDGFTKTQDWQTTERDLLIVDPEKQVVVLGASS